jgi:hypothetical protein
LRKSAALRRLAILRCTYCGAEIGAGESYWYVNGGVVCSACLPDFARWEYEPCRLVRGEEAMR